MSKDIDSRLEKMYKDAALAVDPLEFKPACVACEHMVEGDNGAAACDAHGCFKPTRDEMRQSPLLARSCNK